MVKEAGDGHAQPIARRGVLAAVSTTTHGRVPPFGSLTEITIANGSYVAVLVQEAGKIKQGILTCSGYPEIIVYIGDNCNFNFDAARSSLFLGSGAWPDFLFQIFLDGFFSR